MVVSITGMFCLCECTSDRILNVSVGTVKPQNILVSTRKGKLEFKLADLGLSHFQLQGGADAYGRDTRGTRTYGNCSFPIS